MNAQRGAGAVVVITGASGGLGREAARQFAALGYSLMLAGRRLEGLEDTAALCREAGGQAAFHITDVSREEDVQNLAAAAIAQFGRIDVWVNNAGVTSFARLEDGPLPEHRQVIETNLFGAIYGARAALPIFRQQQRGVLINVGSVLSNIGQPFVPSYVISKFAVRGLSEALRAEVADVPGISVCTLLPYAMDTEHFESGANHYGRAPHPMPPLQSPEKVARALVRLALHPARQRYVPRAAALGVALHAMLPRSVERVVSDALERWHFGTEPQLDTSGNLFQPRAAKGAVHGTRQPVVSSLRLFSWALARFSMMPLERARAAAAVRGHTPLPRDRATTDGKARAITNGR